MKAVTLGHTAGSLSRALTRGNFLPTLAPSMDTVRLGIVGMGNRGKARLGILRAGKVSGMRVTASCENGGMHRCAHSTWGLGAALLIAAVTLGGVKRAQESAGNQPDQQDKSGWGAFVS